MTLVLDAVCQILHSCYPGGLTEQQKACPIPHVIAEAAYLDSYFQGEI